MPLRTSPNASRRKSPCRLPEVRYRRLFESAKEGILILDAHTLKIITVDANPFAEAEMLGYTHDEFMGKELWEIPVYSRR